jgi:hypothetical protein
VARRRGPGNPKGVPRWVDRRGVEGLLASFRVLAGGEDLETAGTALLERACRALQAEEGAILLAEDAFTPGPAFDVPGRDGRLGSPRGVVPDGGRGPGGGRAGPAPRRRRAVHRRRAGRGGAAGHRRGGGGGPAPLPAPVVAQARPGRRRPLPAAPLRRRPAYHFHGRAPPRRAAARGPGRAGAGLHRHRARPGHRGRGQGRLHRRAPEPGHRLRHGGLPGAGRRPGHHHPRARVRLPVARPRQDRRARRGPQQGRAAHRRGVGADPGAPGDRPAHPGGRAAHGRGQGGGLLPPRALGRGRLPGGPQGPADPAGRAGVRRRGRLRRDHHRPPLPGRRRVEEALRRLRAAAGSQFAPDAVEAIHQVDRERLAAIQATAATAGR